MGQGIIYGDNAIFATKHFKSKGYTKHTRKHICQCNCCYLKFDRRSNLDFYILCVQKPRILSYLRKIKIGLKSTSLTSLWHIWVQMWLYRFIYWLTGLSWLCFHSAITLKDRSSSWKLFLQPNWVCCLPIHI